MHIVFQSYSVYNIIGYKVKRGISMGSIKSILAVIISFALCLAIQAGLKVGYAGFTARESCPTFTESASHVYTIIVVSFGVVNGFLVSIPDDFLGPYHNINELKTDMAAVKKAYPNLEVFLSFVGEANT